MYDKIKVFFEDGTSTILFVDVDDEMQDVLAKLEDDTGVAVVRYEVKQITYVKQTDFITPNDW